MTKSLLGLGWCVAVLATYYFNSAAYYTQKISEFGAFFLGHFN